MKKEELKLVISETQNAFSFSNKAQMNTDIQILFQIDEQEIDMSELEETFKSLPVDFTATQVAIGVETFSEEDSEIEWIDITKNNSSYIISDDSGVKSTPFSNLADATNSAFDSAMCGFPTFKISNA